MKVHFSKRSRLLVAGALGAASCAAWTTTAFAQDATMTAPPPVVAEQKTYSGPNRALLIGGLATLGASYIPAVIVAAESNTPIDNQLNIPVVGPWLNIAQRPPCGSFGEFSCSAEGGYKALLIIDGVFQGLGALATVSSFFLPEHATVTKMAKAEREKQNRKVQVTVTPASLGAGGYGLSALGKF